MNTDMTSCDSTPSVSANEMSENDVGRDTPRHTSPPVCVYCMPINRLCADM